MRRTRWSRWSDTRCGKPANHPRHFRLEFKKELPMPTQEIQREEWHKFFEAFSRQHEGWLATLEIFAPDVGAQEEAHELPLEGISITSGGNGADGIAISLGKTPEDHVTHTVTKPEHVWLEQTSGGANAALEIESESQNKALLRFRSALPPEMVDGVVMD